MVVIPSYTVVVAILATIALGSPLNTEVQERQTVTCAPVHLFVARGTYEAAGDGSIGSLAALIIKANPGATQEAIDYPASTSPTYIADVSTGITAVTNQFKAYTAACPQSKLVLLGYSQGAQIILDALCGSGSTALGGNGEPTITTSEGANIAAIVGYGDPGHVAGESWDQGTATIDGIYARPRGACKAWANVIHSWCNYGDPYCASGNNVYVHLSYPQTDNSYAAAWANQQIASHSS
ncbi:cutinase [Penicillium atrosanguineum]|nr:cutinase [Penicillium atrosanguineum]